MKTNKVGGSKSKKQKFLEILISKYNQRLANGTAENGKRIKVSITKVFPNYESRDIPLDEYDDITETIRALERDGIVEVNMKCDDFIDCIWMSPGKGHAAEILLESEFGIAPRAIAISKLKAFATCYTTHGELTAHYCNELIQSIASTSKEFDDEKEMDIIKALAFIEKNTEDLFIREASMKIFGTSKVLENSRIYAPICRTINTVCGNDVSNIENEVNENYAPLAKYHIKNVSQSISIKGDIDIICNGYSYHVKALSEGLSVSYADLKNISEIRVNVPEFMTIENKTAYERVSSESIATMYLGGFANHHQIEFLKKLISLNPTLKYTHFGDIDIGGYLIVQHLSNNVGVDFLPVYMGVAELQNPNYAACLQPLSDKEKKRASSIVADARYRDSMTEIIKVSKKLEQEIIALDIFYKDSPTSA